MLKLLYNLCMFDCACACLYQDTLELLQARVSALDSATLDQVEARLQVQLEFYEKLSISSFGIQWRDESRM